MSSKRKRGCGRTARSGLLLVPEEPGLFPPAGLASFTGLLPPPGEGLLFALATGLVETTASLRAAFWIAGDGLPGLPEDPGELLGEPLWRFWSVLGELLGELLWRF